MARNEEEPRDLRRQVREIADSLAIAFILAMIIRHYVLEVFKIPTKSMEPTLLGDPWTGDKILVNKFSYDFRDPERWEVGVFKYPEDISKNYIKRFVGLPGERIRVRGGDVYINGKIARKPWRVQRALWRRRGHELFRLPQALMECGADDLHWLASIQDARLQALRAMSRRELSYRGLAWLKDIPASRLHAIRCMSGAELVWLRRVQRANPPTDPRVAWVQRLQDAGAEYWVPDNPERWRLEGSDFVAECQDAENVEYLTYGAEVAGYRRQILAYEERNLRGRPFQPVPTTDLMVSFTLTPRRLAGSLHVAITIEQAAALRDVVDAWNVVFPLGPEDVRVAVSRSGAVVARSKPFRLKPGQSVDVAVCNVDRTIIVRMNDHELVHHEYGPNRRVVERIGFVGEASVAIGCKATKVRIGSPAISVDVYYTDYPDRRAVREEYQLGPDEFFVLGDNSCNSNDSRGWRNHGAVPRDYLVGEAFMVLWPLGRIKLVR